MAKEIVVDRYLELLQAELRTRKAVRTVLRERLEHEDKLIIDIERKIIDYVNSDSDKEKHIKQHIN